MASFEETGIREELLRTLEEEDIDSPTALQAAVIPSLRRGGNLVARASSGAGKTLAYALGVFDRLAGDQPAEDSANEGAAIRALVVVPTHMDAQRAATGLTSYAEAAGLVISALSHAWADVAGADVVIASAPDAMGALRSSEVKLERVKAIVIDGAAIMEKLGHWDEVDNLLELIPSSAQRIIFSASIGDSIRDLVERRVKKALRYPSEPALASLRPRTPEATLSYVIATELDKLDLLAGQLRGREAGSAPPIVFCRTDERAADLAESLAIRGFAVGDTEDGDVDVVVAAGDFSRAELLEDEEGGEIGQTISFDVPPDLETYTRRHGGDSSAVLIAKPRELAHVREIAAQAGLAAASTPVPDRSSTAARELGEFRKMLRTAIRDEDLSAQMLVLEPLLNEFSAPEIAAALAALLRSRRPAPSVASDPQPAAAEAPSSTEPVTKAPPVTGAPAGPPPSTYTRLYVGVGSKEEVRAGDLVGALAGEADVPGSTIGKIEIRESFSIVEVQSDVAEKVIRAVNGTTIKGRSVRVDYDRGGPAKRPSAKAGGQRRQTRRPPRS